MSIFRSYFSKNNTLIARNVTNNSQNPVTEISYGTPEMEVSRFIFDVDLSNIKERLSNGLIGSDRIVKHVLHMTNTIRYAPKYIGRKSYDSNIQRASSFDLELFNINQEWDEGSGYDVIFNNIVVSTPVVQAANWYSATTITEWSTAGAYNSGTTEIIGGQHFDKGNEDIEIDITDYINQRLNNSGSTYSGNSYGLGIKFEDIYESLDVELREAIAFHAKNTNTWYEPYIETTIDDIISDDRNYFYLNKDNYLYLYSKVGGNNADITVNSVKIYDSEGDLYLTLTGSSIINVSLGVYKIMLNINPNEQPDSVLFTDEWDLIVNGKSITHSNDFYLISEDNYYDFDNSNDINLDNYCFYYWGISEREKISAGNIRKIELSIKELYPNQDNFIPLDIEYRVFTSIAGKYEIDIVPYTSVNRTNKGYYFNLDTAWLIPQDYKLQIRLKNGNYYKEKETLSFTVVSNGILKK